MIASKSPDQPPSSSLHDRSLLPGWVDELRETGPEAAAELLAEADDLRESDTDGRKLALGCYLGLQHRIDIATAPGTERVRWLLQPLSGLTAEFEPLMRRAAVTALDPVVREAAGVGVGICLVRAGELARAEGHLRAALTAVRGTGRPAEYAACIALHSVFFQQHRIFESLVVARRAMLLTSPVRHAFEHADASTRVCYGLTLLEAWDALAETLAQTEAVLPGVPANRRQDLALRLSSIKVNRDLFRERFDDALTEIEHVETVVKATGAYPEQQRWIAALRGNVMLEAGRHEGAAALLDEALASGPHDDAWGLRLQHLSARCSFERGLRDEAVARARGALDVITGGLETELGSGILLKLGNDLGDVLDRAVDLEGAGRAFELAAMAATQRVIELDQCIRYLPELSMDVDSDRTLFARARPRLIESHERTLASVARVFERAIADGESWVRRLLSDGRYFRVCAWCHRFQTADGTWTPGGHYLAGQQRGRLTHGMCEDCLDDLKDEHPHLRSL